MNFWNSDHIFRIGSTHKVCEDYASSSGSTLAPNSCHAVLGDGCSLCLDSENHPIQAHTDFGSRLLTKAAQRTLADCLNFKGGMGFEFGDDRSMRSVVDRAARSCEEVGLGLNTLSSTLLMTWIDGDMIRWVTCGDGAFAYRQRYNKQWTIANIVFDSGMPYYLRYEMNLADLSCYSLAGGCDFYIRRWNLASDGTLGDPWDVFHRWEGRRIPSYFSKTDIGYSDMFLMFSDGISSFVKKDPETGIPVSVPLTDAIRPFLSLKNLRGEFVYRRANAALREFADQGIVHTDDFSMIAVVVD